MDEGWTEVAKEAEVPEQGTLQVSCDGEPVCLYKVGGNIYATHDTCTHGQASLAEGFIVEDWLIQCPLHGGMFDIRTGEAVGVPCDDGIRVYPVKIDKDSVFVKA